MGLFHGYVIDGCVSVLIIIHQRQELSSSGFHHSIAIFSSYKTAYFQKSKTTDHLGYALTQFTRDIVLCFFQGWSGASGYTSAEEKC